MHFPHNVSFVRMCVFSPQQPTRMHTFSPQCTFPTMYHLYLSVYVPHNNQLGRTDFPDNALSPQSTFPTMYHLYVCVYFPHNDQLGRTDFPHNALSPQCIICTYVCIFPTTTNQDAHIFRTMHFPHNVSFVLMCVRSPQRPTRMHGLSPQCTFPTMYRWYV